MQDNPYAAPTAAIDDVRTGTTDDLESRKATRGSRLGAALLDGLIALFWLAPILWSRSLATSMSHGVDSMRVFGVAVMVVVIAINCVLLHRHGQTIGKRTLNIAVLHCDGSRIGLGSYILRRVMPVSLFTIIPFVGNFIGLVDVLLIFGRERRCLHDLIADTIVVVV